MWNGVPVTGRTLSDIAPLFKKSGVAVMNLEIPLTTMTRATPNKSAKDIAARNQYVLKASPGHGSELKSAGIDMVSMGNNHAMDYRLAGLRQMTGVLDKLGIGHTGAGINLADARKCVVTVAPDGTRVGLISSLAFMNWGGAIACTPATPTAPGVNFLRFGGKIDDRARSEIRAWVADAKRNCDFLIVGLHWGIERQTVPSAYQVALARAFIEEGADVVWGHHPHVLQGAELYKGKPIMYSMGNMVSPRPASTGVIRIYFENRAYKAARFYPCSIDGGRVRLSGSGPGRMKGLSQAMTRSYRHPDSQPMFQN